MRIGGREIGSEFPPYVIAEVGVNHDGSADRALELTRLAARAGADAVKFQLFEADRLMSRAAKLAAYQRAAGETDPVAMLRRLELPIGALEACAAEAHRLGVHAIVSVFSVELVNEAERVPWDAYKTASPDVINRPLLDALAATGRPMLVSTGASTLAEVERMLGWMAGVKDRLGVLQCVSAYPTPIEHAAPLGMMAISGVFPGGVVGYSDHTTGVEFGGVMAGLGAMVLEKHLTYDRNATGPDHGASLGPEEFAAYVRGAREGWRRGARTREGTIEKVVLAIEQDVRRVSRQSLTSARAMRAGEVVRRADLTIKRPGTGLPPYEMERVAGCRLARDVEADMPLCEADVLVPTMAPR